MEILKTTVLPLYIHTRTFWSVYVAQSGWGQSNITKTTNWTAGLAIFHPITIPWDYPVKRVYWYNGSAVAGNVDFGIYSMKGAKFFSTGNTAQAGTSVIQYVTPTRFILPAGSWLFAISGSSTGRITYSADTLGRLRMIGLMQQSSANPLPSPATFATLTNALAPIMGVTRV